MDDRLRRILQTARRRGLLEPDRFAAARDEVGDDRPLGLLRALLRLEALAPGDLGQVLVELGVAAVCETCGEEPGDLDACPGCHRHLGPDPRVVPADPWLVGRPGDLRPGRPTPEEGTDLARYAVRRQLGRGGMGVVLEARDVRLARPVALKFVRLDRGDAEDRAARFIREGRLLASLDHPNVVRVYDAGRHRGGLWLAMELVRGRSMADRTRAGELDRETALDALEAVAGALEACHGAGVVHRDVKPSNIVIEEETARVLLIDFGLARDESASGDLTLPGQVLGTPYYLSPEQVAGRGDVDGRADVWALGVSLYEVLLGRRPFTGDSAVDIARKVLKCEPEPLREDDPEVPRPLVDVAFDALTKKRSDRLPSPEAFAGALHRAREGGGRSGGVVPAIPSSGDLPRTRSRRRRSTSRASRPSGSRLPALLAGAVVLAGIGLLVWTASEPAPSPDRTDRTAASPGPPAGAPPASPPRDGPPDEPARPDPSDGVDRQGPGDAGGGEEPPDDDGTDPPEDPPGGPADPDDGVEEPTSTPHPPEDPPTSPADAPSREDGSTAGPPDEASGESTGEEEPPPPGPVVPALDHRAWQVRALVLGRLGNDPPPEAVPALVERLDDDHPLCRRLARRALAACPDEGLRRLGGRRLHEALHGRGGDGDPTRSRLLERLGAPGELGPGAAVGEATGELTRPDLSGAVAAGEALASTPDEGLEVGLVLDVTASMVEELEAIRELLVDLLRVLAELSGEARLAVCTFGKDLLLRGPLVRDPGDARRLASRLAPEDDPSNTTIEEAVDRGVEGALHREVGWRRDARRVLIICGDAPPPADREEALLERISLARRHGFRVAALRATPPERYRRRADPAPIFARLGEVGGGPVIPLGPDEDPWPALVSLATGVAPDLLAPLLEAWEATR